MFINLKRGNRIFSPAINALTCTSSWHQVALVGRVTSDRGSGCIAQQSMGQSTTKGTAHFPPPCSHPGLPAALLQSLLPMLLALSVSPAQLHCPNSAGCCHCEVLCVQAGDWDNCTEPLHAAGRRDVASLCGGRWNQAFSPQALELMECPCHSLGLCPHALGLSTDSL